MHYVNCFRISVIILSFLITNNVLIAQVKEQPLTFESYYKVKWGYANEFINLWKKNHYPLLKKVQEKGDIISISTEKPMMHSSEDTRWDFRVIIVYRNSMLALAHNITDQYKKQLYPDLDKLAAEEKHRFELLLAHWDILTEKMDLPK